MISVVILDFDGVILETAQIKTRAFETLFKDSGHVDRIRKYHIDNSGISRHVKIREIREGILRLTRDEADERALAERFASLIEAGVAAAPFVPGAREFIASPGGRLVYVASGTPERELHEIAKARGIDRAFAGIFGSPALKPAIVRRILAAHGLQPSEVVFVGDGLTDQLAARETGVHFVARRHDEGDLEPCEFEIPDLTPLAGIIEELERRAGTLTL